MKVAVIIPAAGASRRFGAADGGEARSKIEMDLAGRPVFLRAVELFLGRADVGQILLAVNPDQLDAFAFRWGDKLRFHDIRLVPGGTIERWETVARALEQVSADCTHIAVHDAARPLASAALIDRVFVAAEQHAAVVPALAVSDTLKRVEAAPPSVTIEPDPMDAILGSAGKPAAAGDATWRVVETVSRAGLMAVQTPQIFTADLLRRAYAPVIAGRLDAAGITDDASLVETLGEPVHVVEGEPLNFKITRRDDLELATAILAHRASHHAAEAGRKQLFGDDEDE